MSAEYYKNKMKEGKRVRKLESDNAKLKAENKLMDEALMALASYPTTVGRLAKELITEIREKLALSDMGVSDE